MPVKLPDGVRMARLEALFETIKYEMISGLADGDVSEYVEFNFFGPPSKSVPNAVMRGRVVLWPSKNYYAQEPEHEHD